MKKKIKIAIIIFLVLAGIGGIMEMVGSDNATTQENLVEEMEEESVLEQREDAIGQSNKDFLELTKTKPSSVREDNTGNWRKVAIADSVDIVEYVASYNELYMEQGQVHAIVNFNYNTTTMINDLGGMISVRIHEYVDKEEHDANKLGSGMLLKEYQVYKDNRDIIEVQ
ncbi:hypothetical protein [Clostridium formicaceticum]|uniref:Uncharacterized protein n=1 Tax=Clostridium formicaceticum TaxID=1497 RepID=A0AAC9WFX7_9CLOT|nr:hypothetical protein [Clostridium formicaceticum]AOY76907.1 hypothetical protein BJL90_14215 [Clostridium formicaceticum]ARE87387.1 hypothetical protein CLFO_17870 [Clostridium formicaceticum]